MGISKMKYRARISVIAKLLITLVLGTVMACSVIASTRYTAYADDDTQGSKFYSEYTSLEETWEASLEVNQQIAEESVVMLKNKDDVLPLSGVKNISIFGKDSGEFYYAGGGSGTAEGYYDDDQYYTLQESLEDAGYSVNPALQRFYEDENLSGSYSDVDETGLVNETDVDDFTDTVLNSYARYNDAALIVLGRTGSEGGDLYMGDGDDSSVRHALELTENEEKLVKHVTENFDIVIVVLNVPMAMELGWVMAEEGDDEYIGDIDVCLWIGHPGLNGIVALGETLNGTINPSGRLADTYARDFTQDPTYFNAQDNLHIENGTSDYIYGDEYFHSIEYEEGIYYGYRYYETRGAEDEEWYQENIVYPFGYGESFTTFEWELGTVKNTFDESDGSGYVTIPVTVTNTGDVAGKDVVELYYTAPYIEGEIEKSHVVLGAYAKTDLLKPGKSQTLNLQIYWQDMASYDDVDKNDNGFQGYELDAGEYVIKLMTDSHNIKTDSDDDELVYTYSLSAGVTYTTDRITGNEVSNKFTDNEDSSYDSFGGMDGDMTELSRSDWEGTWPTTPIGEYEGEEGTLVRNLSDDAYNTINFSFEVKGTEDEEDQVWYDYYNDMDKTDWAQEEDNDLSFYDMAGVDFDDDETWDKFINQMSWDEMINLCYDGGYQTIEVESVDMPATQQQDGPVAIKGAEDDESGIQWVAAVNVAATWNTELAKLRGIMIGNEALHLGLNGWYAPGVNLHRSPFGGRNFEYFAEDGYLAGSISAATVQGVQSKGIICFVKHFALNNQEEDRGGSLPGLTMAGASDFGVLTWATEQTCREIYFKAFQMSIEEGGALGVMTSMNMIGMRSNSNNFNLTMGILRQEWGFKGFTVTDIIPTDKNNPYADSETLTRVGIDTPLAMGGDTSAPTSGEWDADNNGVYVTTDDGDTYRNDISWAAVRDSVKRVAYATVHSAAYNNGLNLDEFTDSTLSVYIGVSSSVAVNAGDLGTDDVVYEMTSGTLPEGITFNSDGTLTGTPMQAGAFTFTVKMNADGWITKEVTYTLVIVNDLFENTSATVDAGTELATEITSEYFDDSGINVEYEIYSGELPDGITLASDGTLTGTATEAGVYTVTIQATAIEESEDTGSGSSTTETVYYFDYTLTVNEADSEGDELTLSDLQDQISALEATVAELQTQLDEVSASTDSSSSSSDSGCGSVIAVESIVIITVVTVAAAVVVIMARRKRNA